MRPLCLDYLTVAEARPAEQARIAAANDCRLMTVKIWGAAPPIPDGGLVSDAAERRDLQSACRSLGVSVDMLESFNLTPEADLEAFRTPFAVGADLGARSANVLVREDEPRRLADRFGRVCDMAAEYGLAIYIELSRRMASKTPGEGAAFLARSGCSSARLLVDTLHFFRNGQAVVDLAAGQGLIGRLQLCDGPPAMEVDLQLEEAIHERLPPGEGALPLAALLAAVPEDIVAGLEVPMRSLQARGVTPAERAARVFAATRRLMGAPG